MHIIEIGFIVDGLLVYYKNYKPENRNFITNADLRNSLLDAIVKMTQNIFKQKMTDLKFRGYNLFLHVSSLFKKEDNILANMMEERKSQNGCEEDLKKLQDKDYTDIVLYIIGDKDVDKELANDLLKKTYKEFLSSFPQINKGSLCDTTVYEKFTPKLNELLADLTKSEEDRFSSLF
ncbi:MAG: hypothetical protein ACTSU2_07655 [Promethearchaeota archaeon]